MEEYNPDFVILPRKTSDEAVALLLERFPWIRSLVESDEDLTFAGAYSAYELAEEVPKRLIDQEVYALHRSLYR